MIVDEAHSSQSGKSAQAMTDALTREATSSDDIEDLIAEYQKQRGPQANISFLRLFRYAPQRDPGAVRN